MSDKDSIPAKTKPKITREDIRMLIYPQSRSVETRHSDGSSLFTVDEKRTNMLAGELFQLIDQEIKAVLNRLKEQNTSALSLLSDRRPYEPLVIPLKAIEAEEKRLL